GRAARFSSGVRMGREARAGRDQPADDDVLLQSAQVILEAAHCRFRQYSGGLLEGGGRDEGFRGEGGLGDAEQHRLQGGTALALVLGTVVNVKRPRAVELLTAQKARLTGHR